MNSIIRVFACLLAVSTVVVTIAISQLRPLGPLRSQTPTGLPGKIASSHQPMAKSDSTLSFYKRKAEWQKLIDSYWGPGDSYAQKLYVFDTYASHARANFPAFVYSKLNWDSVAAYWRARITDATSRGAFHAILRKFACSLNEWHASAGDLAVDAMPLTPGTPGVSLPGHDVRHFGAALTPLPDKSLLVYKVIANHPLGLQRGDRVLGYEGVLWPQLINELLEAGVGTDVLVGGCPTAKEYYRLAYAGMFWHLFDTIDVVKYGSGQVVHLPTAPLTGLDVSSPLLQCDQLPIAGVPMPSEDLLSGDVTYGTIQGTNIGYIYVRHHTVPKISTQFDAAVQALTNTDGLIIDLRLDYGGIYGLRQGIGRLVNFGDSTLQAKRRHSASDLQTMVPATVLDYTIPQDGGTMYDRPITVLVGPQSRSTGDISAWELSYIPNARFFGKSTTGAFSGNWWSNGPTVPGYYLLCPDFILVDHRFPEVQLLNTELPIDEEVWLTPDGVAKGQDDVVTRAIEWITTLAYAHDVQVSRQGTDTVRLTAHVENPLAHSLKVVVTYKDTSGTIADSSLMYNDGLHGDGAPGDSVWGWLYLPNVESVYHLSVRTDDLTAGTSRTLPDVAQFVYTQKALLSMDTRTVELGNIYHALSRFDTTFQVSNLGWSPDSIYVSLDPILTPDSAIAVSPIAFALAPGGSQAVTFSVMPHWLSKGVVYNAVVSVYSRFGFGQPHFEKTFAFAITPVSDEPSLPMAFALDQNYPNPFNPSTTIRYGLPHKSAVQLTVYNTLGQQVATLVQGEEEPGYHEVKFDATKLSSGVYFYRLEAGNFVQTKKLVVLR